MWSDCCGWASSFPVLKAGPDDYRPRRQLGTWIRVALDSPLGQAGVHEHYDPLDLTSLPMIFQPCYRWGVHCLVVARQTSLNNCTPHDVKVCQCDIDDLRYVPLLSLIWRYVVPCFVRHLCCPWKHAEILRCFMSQVSKGSAYASLWGPNAWTKTYPLRNDSPFDLAHPKPWPMSTSAWETLETLHV